MVKKLYLVVLIIAILISSFSILKITKDKEIIKKNNFGELIINKINLDEELFSINSSENTIEKHVTILKESIYPDDDNSIMIIAAHSGIGRIAYFNELDKLEINDEIVLIYKDKKYIYVVKDIWEEKKNGYININKEKKKQLVLTTCSPNKDNYQLIINCIEKESN